MLFFWFLFKNYKSYQHEIWLHIGKYNAESIYNVKKHVSYCDGVDVLRRCVLQEDQSSFSKSGTRFCSSRQNPSTLSSSSLSSNLMYTYLFSVMQAARNTSIASSQNALLDNKISEMCVSFLASNTVFLTITKPVKAWMVSNESLKTYLLNLIHRMYK